MKPAPSPALAAAALVAVASAVALSTGCAAHVDVGFSADPDASTVPRIHADASDAGLLDETGGPRGVIAPPPDFSSIGARAPVGPQPID